MNHRFFLVFVVLTCLAGSIAAARAEYCQVGWSNDAAPLPQARYRAGGGVYEGKVYVWGGSQSNWKPGKVADYTYFKDLWIYDPDADEWTAGADMPFAKSNFGFAIVDGFAYAVAGYYSDEENNPHYVANAYRYDIAGKSWSAIADYPEIFSGLMCADGGDGKLYCFGGWDGVNDKKIGYVYDPGADDWTSIADMPAWKDFGYAVLHEGTIYAAGGWWPSGGDPRLFAYHPAGDDWSELALSTGRQSPVLAGAAGLLWLAGGSDENDELLHVANQKFDGAMWSPTGDMMFADRAGAVAGYVPGYGIFIVGGWNADRVGTTDNQLWGLCVPELQTIEPAIGPSGTAVVITGAQFEQNVFVYLADSTKARWLLDDITVVNGTTIQATIPDDVPSGVYSLVFQGTLGQVAEFSDAYEVTSTDDDTADDDTADDDTADDDMADDDTADDDSDDDVDDDADDDADDDLDDDIDDDADDDSTDDDQSGDDDDSGCGC